MVKLHVLLFLIALNTAAVQAFCVYNRIRHGIKVEIKGVFKEWISAGGKACCHWSNCGGSSAKVQKFWITSSNGALQIIAAQAGGCIHVVENDVDWNWPKGSSTAEMIQSISYRVNPDKDGSCFGMSLYHMEPYLNWGGIRSVHFLATADPQYWIEAKVKDVPDQTIATMKNLLSGDVRGVIVAGDLVQRADFSGDLYQAYSDAIDGMKRYFFDGVGNHDLDPKDGYWKRIKEILTEIGDRNRVTVTNKRGGYPSKTPDYSWNWDDVHFVQMNDYPGGDSLKWLKSDLEENVGTSGNPVVMIHHYGFEDFSREERWWTHDDRRKYWDVIKYYDVIAIFTGHTHDPVNFLQYWSGDDYLKGAEIPFFISGSANQDGGKHESVSGEEGRGYFLEVSITESELLVQRRHGDDGSLEGRVSVALKPTKVKLLCAGCVLNETGRNEIFDNIPGSGSILTVYPNPAINELRIDVESGNKSEQIEGVEIFDRKWDQFDVPVELPASRLKFSISHLPPYKFYLLRVKLTSGGVEQRRFWKDTDEDMV